MKIAAPLRQHPDFRQLSLRLLRTVSQRGMRRERVRNAIAIATQNHQGVWLNAEPVVIRLLQVANLLLALGGDEDDVTTVLLCNTWANVPTPPVRHVLFAWGTSLARRYEALSSREDPRHTMDVHIAAIHLADRCYVCACSERLGTLARGLLALEIQADVELALRIGAHGIAQFLQADPQLWWEARNSFVDSLSTHQPAFLV